MVLVHSGVLGLNLEYQKRTREAADIYRDACHMLESLDRLQSHDGAALLTCLAQQLLDEDPQKALQQYQRAWSIREETQTCKTLDASDPETNICGEHVRNPLEFIEIQ